MPGAVTVSDSRAVEIAEPDRLPYAESVRSSKTAGDVAVAAVVDCCLINAVRERLKGVVRRREEVHGCAVGDEEEVGRVAVHAGPAWNEHTESKAAVVAGGRATDDDSKRPVSLCTRTLVMTI